MCTWITFKGIENYLEKDMCPTSNYENKPLTRKAFEHLVSKAVQPLPEKIIK